MHRDVRFCVPATNRLALTNERVVASRKNERIVMATAVEGKGAVPDIPLLSAVVKRLFELPTAKTFASNGLPVQWPAGFDFTADGLSAQVPAAVL